MKRQRGLKGLEVGEDEKIIWGEELVSWCFKPSQPQRITSGLRLGVGEVEKTTDTIHTAFYIYPFRSSVINARCALINQIGRSYPKKQSYVSP